MSPNELGEGSLGERREGLVALRRAVALAVVSILGLVGAGQALAASPQEIYADLADNGRLDKRYSEADIARAFNLQKVVGTDEQAPPAARTTRRDVAASKRSGGKVPFTGLDLALLTMGGGPLLLIGMGLRRRFAPTASQPEVVSG